MAGSPSMDRQQVSEHPILQTVAAGESFRSSISIRHAELFLVSQDSHRWLDGQRGGGAEAQEWGPKSVGKSTLALKVAAGQANTASVFGWCWCCRLHGAGLRQQLGCSVSDMRAPNLFGTEPT
jgi:hypothetical protein